MDWRALGACAVALVLAAGAAAQTGARPQPLLDFSVDELARIEQRLSRRGLRVGAERLRAHLELSAGPLDAS